MAEEEDVKGGRQRLMERYNNRFPERTWDDDEAIFAQINDDYDEYDKELSSLRERDQQIADLFARDPRSAAFLMDWRDGGDPLVLLIRKYGDDFKAALENPDMVDAIAEANQEYAQRVADEEEHRQHYQENIAQTNANIDAVKASLGASDEQIEEAMVFLIGVMHDAIVGKFSTESIEMAVKALNHDADVELAEEAGEVRGRNAKIEEHLRRTNRGDGTASLNGRNGSGSSTPRPELGAIDRYMNAPTIWQRGNEKRFTK